MTKYLFLYSITPVQTFISQARKTQDLYAGSSLLSKIIDNLITKFELGEELIFPEKESKYKPNRFVAQVQAENKQDIVNLGEDLQEAAYDYVKSIADKVISKLNIQELKETIYKQLNHSFYTYWTAVELDEDNYSDCYRKLESRMGAVKNLRTFEQLKNEVGRKDSITGELNALVYSSDDSGADTVLKNGLKKKFFTPNSTNLANSSFDFSLVNNEGLSAITLLKRFSEKTSFPSTAEIALMDTVKRIEKNMNKEENVGEALERLKNNNSDFQLFYEENHTSEYYRKQNIKHIKSLNYEQQTISNYCKQNNLKLTKHYALVKFDGDYTGKILQGDYLKDLNYQADFHKELTKYLHIYSEEIKKILSDVKGRIVYAGGEDFLGFINLNHIFDTLSELRAKFDEIVNKPLKKKYFKDEKNITFSAGVAIAHYKIPLNEVVSAAEIAEKEAKEFNANYTNGKNAINFSVLKHSGERVSATLRWYYDNKRLVTEILKEITNFIHRGYFSKTFISNIDYIVKSTFGYEESKNYKEVIQTEYERLLNRALMVEKKPDENQDTFIKRKDQIFNKMRDNTIMLLNERHKGFNNFTSILNILEFISRELNNGENDVN